LVVIHLMLRSGRSSTFAQKLSSNPKTIMYMDYIILDSWKNVKKTRHAQPKRIRDHISVKLSITYIVACFQITTAQSVHWGRQPQL
jgi:type IV secretory pathway VirB6-like protein